ncbi:MAG TPA: glycoside hydrolase family 38 C-terminal domain-containing protein, partial [Rhizomicrobium sp.]|nr:glycoside hydrolase family 38 C-terminal domain-containing protein [Rhizomicrobium sp.]
VLTNQFHDILPGSSIGEVYTQTEEELTDIAEKAQALCDTLLARLCTGTDATPVNTLGVPRAEIATTPSGALAHITAEPFSIGRTTNTADNVTVEENGGTITLRNAALTAVLARDGHLVSLIHNATQREALAGPANRILLFDDQPLDYDAWDIDPFALETARDAAPAHSCTIVTRDLLRAELRFERKLGRDSTLIQIVRLDAGANNLVFDTTIDWRERKTLVKAMFPLDIRAGHATYETMFGAAERPTHANTDGDLAKYEVPGQRWADLSEPGFGLSLLSDVKHGYSCLGNQLALSFIRGPMMPDPNADIGTHRFRYALYPHAGDWRNANTVAHAAAFTRPLLWAKGTPDAILQRPLATASAPNVIVDTIKPAEDGDGWIVRLYESTGARTNATLTFNVPVKSAALSNTLEDVVTPLTLNGNAFALKLRPFQIATLKLT